MDEERLKRQRRIRQLKELERQDRMERKRKKSPHYTPKMNNYSVLCVYWLYA